MDVVLMIASIFMAVASVLIIASLMPVLRADAWWIRSFDFPRLQIFIAGAVIVPVWWKTTPPETPLEWTILSLLFGAVVLQAVRITPYTKLMPPQVAKTADSAPTRNSISLVIANVLMSNRNTAALLEVVRDADPDILLTVETDERWIRELGPLDSDYPHSVKIPLDNRYGMALFSKLDLIEPRSVFLLKDNIPSIHSRVRLRSGSVVWLHALHPEPPSPTEADQSTKRDAELLMVGREVERRGMPAIVAGDLNDVAWSRTTTLFQKASGMLDPRIGRGMFNSFHAKIPIFRWPLDHVFHTQDFFLQHIQRLPEFGSDHFPVFIRLKLSPRAEATHEEPTADAADMQLISEKIAAAVPLTQGPPLAPAAFGSGERVFPPEDGTMAGRTC